jgi:hypothetical protein
VCVCTVMPSRGVHSRSQISILLSVSPHETHLGACGKGARTRQLLKQGLQQLRSWKYCPSGSVSTILSLEHQPHRLSDGSRRGPRVSMQGFVQHQGGEGLGRKGKGWWGPIRFASGLASLFARCRCLNDACTLGPNPTERLVLLGAARQIAASSNFSHDSIGNSQNSRKRLCDPFCSGLCRFVWCVGRGQTNHG